MAKLTKTQQGTLSDMAGDWRMRYFPSVASAWMTDGRFTKKVHIGTFNALTLRGLIEVYQRGPDVAQYRITPAGLSALKEQETGE